MCKMCKTCKMCKMRKVCKMRTAHSNLASGTLQFDQHQLCVEATVEIGLDIFVARSCMVRKKYFLEISGLGHFGLF